MRGLARAIGDSGWVKSRVVSGDIHSTGRCSRRTTVDREKISPAPLRGAFQRRNAVGDLIRSPLPQPHAHVDERKPLIITTWLRPQGLEVRVATVTDRAIALETPPALTVEQRNLLTELAGRCDAACSKRSCASATGWSHRGEPEGLGVR